MTKVDTRPLDEVLAVKKSCAGLSFKFCLEGTDEQIVVILEAVRQLLVDHGARIREAEMFCGDENTQFAVEDAVAIELQRAKDKKE